MLQPVETQDHDVHQSTDLGQGEGYQTDFCKYIINDDDVRMGCDEDIAGIEIDAEPEQCSDLCERTSPFATADERQVCIYPSYLSVGSNDVWSRTARWIAHVQAENQLIRTERSMRGVGTGLAREEIAMTPSKRAKFLHVFG
ncbi:Nn.00g062740.m01.CDS01 [Neocucurbitaria sp. VM-36]